MRGIDKALSMVTTVILILTTFMSIVIAGDEKDTEKESALRKKWNELGAAGKFRDAIPYAEELLELQQKMYGEYSPRLEPTLSYISSLYYNTEEFEKAGKQIQKQIAIMKITRGENAPDLIVLENKLLSLYMTTQQWKEAETLCLKILSDFGKPGRPDSPIALALRMNLAGIFLATGRWEEAEKTYIEIESNVETMGPIARSIKVEVWSALGNLYVYRNPVKAEKYLKMAIDGLKPLLPGDRGNVIRFKYSSLLNALGVTYMKLGKYPEAEKLLEDALVIRSDIYGKDHRTCMVILSNLADLYSRTGRIDLASLRYAELEDLFSRKGIANTEIDLGIAAFAAKTGDHDKAHRVFRRTSKRMREGKDYPLLVMSERQSLDYVENMRNGMSAFVYHTAAFMSGNPDASRESFDGWLSFKGSIFEVQRRYIEAVYSSEDPAIHRKFQELLALKKRIARVNIRKDTGRYTPGNPSATDNLAEMEKESDRLETELKKTSRSFSTSMMIGEVDTSTLARALPRNSVYLDIARVSSFDFPAMKTGPSMYYMFVVTSDAPSTVHLLSLGESETIDLLLIEYRRKINEALDLSQEKDRVKIAAIETNRKELEDLARRIYQKVLAPIEGILRGRTSIIISPDGELGLFPFEVLSGPAGRTLLEDFRIGYVPTGKDVLRWADKRISSEPPLIIADPEYNLGATGMAQGAPTGISRQLGTFSRIADSGEEARMGAIALRQFLKVEPRVILGSEATEDALFNARSPRILHMATHGYYLKSPHMDLQANALDEMGLDTPKSRTTDNPMRRSGLVLAGANTSIRNGVDYGIVSAEKILGLNLSGTELVVLSACNTGVGGVASGEGILGLTRGFILSGAQSVISSLWNVPSKETSLLMSSFYEELSNGKNKSDALRDAKLTLMKDKPHPIFWAPFILTGRPN